MLDTCAEDAFWYVWQREESLQSEILKLQHNAHSSSVRKGILCKTLCCAINPSLVLSLSLNLHLVTFSFTTSLSCLLDRLFISQLLYMLCLCLCFSFAPNSLTQHQERGANAISLCLYMTIRSVPLSLRKVSKRVFCKNEDQNFPKVTIFTSELSNWSACP